MICKRCGGNIDTRRRCPDGSLQCPHCKIIYRPRPTQPQQQNIKRRPQRKKKSVKLIIGFAVLLLLIILLVGSCDSDKTRSGIDIITAMSGQISSMHSIVNHTAETDPNERLGQPGWYSNKIDWVDSRVDEGSFTLEVYTDSKKAKERAEYLETFYGSILADYVVSKHGNYVLRVSSYLNEEEIKNYQNTFDNLIESKDKEFERLLNLGISTITKHESENSFSEEIINQATVQTDFEIAMETSTTPPTQEPTQSPTDIPTPVDTTTMGERNALAKAKSYLDYSAFSYMGLGKQLMYEGFSKEEAKYAVDNCGANWNEQAAKKAASYLEYTSFSRQGLIEQLEYEEFTHEQAVYGVTQVGY